MDFIRNKSHSLSVLKIKSIAEGKEESEFDLRYIFDELNVFHDIDNIVTSGYVTIKEQGNLIVSCPIQGKEIIEIKFKSDFESEEGEDPWVKREYHRVFFVYAVDGLQESGDKRSYTIRFTDALGMINSDMRLSIKYDDKAENIIEKIGNEIINKKELYNKWIKNTYNGTRDVLMLQKDVESEHNIIFTVPNWKPLKLINYITKKAVSIDQPNTEKFADCLFFQSVTGFYKFTSYKHMMTETNKDKKRKFVRYPANITQAITDKYVVENFSFTDLFNSQIQKGGMFGHTTFTVDLGNKEYISSPVPYEDVFEAIKSYYGSNQILKEYASVEMSPDSSHGIHVFNINTDNANDSNRLDFVYPAVVKGIPMEAHMRSLKIFVEMNGASDLDIGTAVDLDFKPHPNAEKHGGDISQFINGTWVIGKIRHTITPTAFKTFVECFTPCINKQGNS